MLLPKQLVGRYERYAIGRDWSAVNIPPDMPTVGRLITELYKDTTGDEIDGVIAADPLAVAEILRVAGPIQAGGAWLDADNVAEETLVRAYVRYEADNNARRAFLDEVAQGQLRGVPAHPGHQADRADPQPGRCRPRPPCAGLCRRPGRPADRGRPRAERQRRRPGDR